MARGFPISATISLELYEKIKDMAAKDNRPLSNMIDQLLTAAVDRREKEAERKRNGRKEVQVID